jgi:hypothetical protein
MAAVMQYKFMHLTANCLLRPATHSRDFENWIWYVMEIEENELENERSGSWALYV